MAYLDTIAEVSKLDNGYVLTARMPLKPKGSDKECGCCCPVDHKEKNVVCKTPEEVAEKLKSLLAWVHDDPGGEYSEAFDEASKEM